MVIKVEHFKSPQKNIHSYKATTPSNLFIPLSQHAGKPSKILVNKGDRILCGQKIGEIEGFVSATLHSPVSGKVKDIDFINHPVLGKTIGLIIQRDERNYEMEFIEEPSKVKSLSPEEMVNRIKERGIVGMGGACFPTHIKLTPPKKIDTLIVNACECEPYLVCDYRLMREDMLGIIKGMEISAYILKPKNIIFALEDNKKDIKKIFYKEFKNFSPLLFAKDKFPSIEVKILKSYYPQGAEKQLIFNTVRRIVPAGGLPFDVGVVVQNVSTLFSIYEALYKDKPLIERLVSFAGSSLKEPKNLWVKIGTLLSDLIEAGDLSLRKSVKKVIFGGPMMGISQDSLDIPILKGTGGVLLFSEEEINIKPEYNCIRCARCIKACPMGLLPCEIYKYAKHQDIENLKKVYPQDCIECGCCSFVCPSGINLVQYIKWAKTVV